MTKTKLSDDADEMTTSHRLQARHAFAAGERVTGPGITGRVLTQDGPWTVTVQQDRGGRITAGTELLSKAS